MESPGNRTASPGQDVALRCTVQAPDEPPDITWHHNGHPLELADSNQLHLPLHEDDWLGTSELRWGLRVTSEGQGPAEVGAACRE